MALPKLGKFEQIFLLLIFIVVLFSKCIAPYFRKVELPLPPAPVFVSSPAGPAVESEAEPASSGVDIAAYRVPPVASMIPTDQEIAVTIEDQKQRKERLETVIADRSQRIEKVRTSVAARQTSKIDPQEESKNAKESDLSLSKEAMTQEEMKQMDPSHGYYMH